MVIGYHIRMRNSILDNLQNKKFNSKKSRNCYNDNDSNGSWYRKPQTVFLQGRMDVTVGNGRHGLTKWQNKKRALDQFSYWIWFIFLIGVFIRKCHTLNTWRLRWPCTSVLIETVLVMLHVTKYVGMHRTMVHSEALDIYINNGSFTHFKPNCSIVP